MITTIVLSALLAQAEPLAASREAGNWLLRMQKLDGSFWYEYDPRTDQTSSGEYNDVRHAGVTWSLLTLYNRTRDERYLRAAENGLDWLFRRAYTRDEVAFIFNDDRASLGATALTLLALVEHATATNNRDHLPQMEAFARFIVSLQRPDGSFESRYQFDPRARAASEPSLYFPGEAILALARLHRLAPRSVPSGDDPDPRYRPPEAQTWLDAAVHGAEEILKRYSGMPLEQLPHDHWLLIAMSELLAAAPREDLATEALRVADAIILSQYTSANCPNPAWYGAWPRDDAKDPPKLASAATRAEALAAACAIARHVRRDETPYRDALSRTARFLLASQIDAARSQTYRNPAAARGVIPYTPEDPRTRMDYAQHTICALLGYEALASPPPNEH